MKIIVDSSFLTCGERIVDTVDSLEEFKELTIYKALAGKDLKRDIRVWLENAQLGDFKDFSVFTIFIGN